MWQRKNRAGRVQQQLTIEEAKHKAASYCSLSEHCPHDVQNKLRQWGAQADDTEAIIDWLIDEQYIDERRYCHAFVNDKIRLQGWGKNKVAQELMARHLPADYIQEAIDDFPEEEYMAILQRVADRKRESLHEEDEQTLHYKLGRYLQGRGF